MGDALDKLVRWRNEADYRLATAGRFANGADATQAVHLAQAAIDLLDQVQADPARRSGRRDPRCLALSMPPDRR